MVQPGQYDIGMDMVRIDRIRSSYKLYGEQFLGKILTPAEISLCKGKADMIQSAAARFAAKEAISKAIGSGISEHFSWHSVEILNDSNGKPFVRVLDERFPVHEQSVRISLSHDREYAAAVVLIVPASG